MQKKAGYVANKSLIGKIYRVPWIWNYEVAKSPLQIRLQPARRIVTLQFVIGGRRVCDLFGVDLVGGVGRTLVAVQGADAVVDFVVGGCVAFAGAEEVDP